MIIGVEKPKISEVPPVSKSGNFIKGSPCLNLPAVPVPFHPGKQPHCITVMIIGGEKAQNIVDIFERHYQSS